MTAERVTDPAAVGPALAAAINNDGPNLVEVMIEGGATN
jgi:thiamine pyrophosphate-dependent acetolactate synthase large subunit-like protein